MNKIKVIDLLNMISKGEEVPKKIKYQNYIYEYQHRRDTKNSFNYMCNENGEYLSRRYFIDNILNDEVEIIEEEKKLPKKIQTIGSKWYCDYIESYIEEEDKYSCYDELLMNKINDLIDYLESKEKGE